MEAIARYPLAAIVAMSAAVGSPEIALFVFGAMAGLVSAPFSYAGRRGLARILALQPEIQSRQSRHHDDRDLLHRSLLELYRQQSISPWSPLLGLIPAAVEIAVVVLLYVALGVPNALPAPRYLTWLSDLSLRDPHLVLAGAMGLLLIVQARGNFRSNPPRQNRLKRLLHMAVPAGKIAIAAALPSGVLIGWLAYSAIAAVTQHVAAAAA
jgi:membrane protein insertase Oxa1/YidC/SpoIIIJ